jgi:hypothetical protein
MKLVCAGDTLKVLQQWSLPFIQRFEAVGECSYYDGGVNHDRVVDDSGCWTWQFGQFEASSCGCHRDRDNTGDQGEIGKHRKAVKLASAIPESAFNVVVNLTANDAAPLESSVVWRCM